MLDPDESGRPEEFQTPPGFERPDEFTEEEWRAFLLGFRRAMEVTNMMTAQYLARLPGGAGEEDGEQEPEICDRCGAETEYEMGTDGSICLNCDR